MTVLCSLGSVCIDFANHEMPMNMMPRQTPMTMSVDRAFFHSGFLNAGTPFEIASTPVMAAPPEANAWSSRKIPTELATPIGTWSAGIGAWARPPVAALYTPTPIITKMLTRNAYVGTANMRPDSRTPRRLPHAMITMKPSAIGTRYGRRSPNAEYSAATPADTETATVRM